MPFTFAASGAILEKAGANVSTFFTGVNAQTNLTRFSDAAEALINATARVDLTAGYSGYSSDKKKILEDTAASYAALLAIAYDPSTFFNLAEAQTKMNVLHDHVNRNLAIIKDDDWKTFVGAT